MNVPVLWISMHPGVILARGYADEGLLEAMLDRSLWRPPNALQFEHHEIPGEFPDLALNGAVVVIPCRHHVQQADFLLQQLDRLDWSLVILAGDEAWEFPWEKITETPTRRVWTMQPIPDHARLSGRIPGGWYQWPDRPNTHEMLRPWAQQAQDRPLDWLFAGQDTHARRHECIEQLRRLEETTAGCLATTDGYMQETISRDDYFRLMASAKVAPSPSGPYSVDCARPLEALEAGTIPVVDLRKPLDPQFDYWDLCFGADYPFHGVTDWQQFPAVLRAELADWPARSNEVFSWWQLWKRKITLQLDQDIREAAEAAGNIIWPAAGPSDQITAIITTSPAPLHPSTEHIEQVVASIRAQLPDAEILIVADGVRLEQTERRADYEEYLRRLLWLSNFEWSNVVVQRLKTWGHQANAVRAALRLVNTPLILFCEHDTPLEGDIDWPGLAAFVASGEANVVRFHFDVEIHPEHEHLMLDAGTTWHSVSFDDLPLRRTYVWWQRPHLASAAFYRDRVMPIFPPESRTMIEDRLLQLVESDYLDHGEPAWWDWRLFIYTPEGGSIKRSSHLDSRGDDEKYPMFFGLEVPE